MNDTPGSSQNHLAPKKSVKINEGYKVKVRSKVQNASQHAPSQRVTASISIDKRSAEFEREIENLTYEDILQMKVQLSQSRKTIETAEVSNCCETPSVKKSVEVERRSSPDKQEQKTETEIVAKPVDNVSESMERNSKVNRSATPTSHHSIQSGLDDLVVGSVAAGSTPSRSARTVGSAQLAESGPTSRSVRPIGSARPDSRSLSRVSSAGRPPPVKANQWRSAPNSVMNGTRDPEYIQIAQKLPVPRPQSQQSLGSVVPGASLKDAIDSVTSCNRPLYSPDGSMLEDDILSIADDTVPLVASEDLNPSPLATPPPSPSPVPEYAFDIPTAGALESDANSVVTPGDLDRELNLSVISDGT